MRWGYSFALAGAMLVSSVIVPGHRTGPGTLRPPLGQSHLTETQALDSARAGAPMPAAARLMSYRAATALLGAGGNPNLPPAKQVWIVTVYKPQQFTVIIDGVNGTVLDSCIGCRAL